MPGRVKVSVRKFQAGDGARPDSPRPACGPLPPAPKACATSIRKFGDVVLYQKDSVTVRPARRPTSSRRVCSSGRAAATAAEIENVAKKRPTGPPAGPGAKADRLTCPAAPAASARVSHPSNP